MDLILSEISLGRQVFIIIFKMANVRGLRDLNNQNQPRRNNNPIPAGNAPAGNLNDDQIPFLTTMKSNRTPME